MTIGNQAFCLIVYSTAVYFRREFQHVGDVIKEKKTSANQSELEKYVVSDCWRNYMLRKSRMQIRLI